MTKKKRVNITVDADIWDLADSMRLNRSEICNDALRVAVDVHDDKKQMMESIERRYKEIQMIEKLMEKVEKADEIVKESIGTDEDRMIDAITTIINANGRRGYVGLNFVKHLAYNQKIDYNELIIKLDELPEDKKVEIRKFQEV